MTKRSFADQKRANDASLKYYATLADKLVPEGWLNNVAEKRTRKPAVRTGPSEHELQSAVFSWWIRAHNTFGIDRRALIAIPNAQILMGSARNPERVMTYLRKEGFQPGFPDLFLAVPRAPHAGLMIEMKTKEGRVSPEQVSYHAFLLADYQVFVCRSDLAAIDTIKAYLGN